MAVQVASLDVRMVDEVQGYCLLGESRVISVMRKVRYA